MTDVKVKSRVRWWGGEDSAGCSWKVWLEDPEGRELGLVEEGRKTFPVPDWDTPEGVKRWAQRWALRRAQGALLRLAQSAMQEAHRVLWEYGDVKEGEECTP